MQKAYQEQRYHVDWTIEDIDALRKAWGEGQTASQISGRMGRTRNSVIGKIHRLGLVKNIQQTPADIAARAAARAERHEALKYRQVEPTQRTRRCPLDRARLVLLEALSEMKAMEDVEIGVALLDLKDDMCRYPITGDVRPDAHRFCGEAKWRGAYCRDHFPIVSAGLPRRRAA